MDVDGLQLSLLELDESPKDEPRDMSKKQRRQKTTASDTSPEPTPAPSRTATETILDADTLLTTEEVATLLRVHPRTVQRLVARGQLAAIHLGSAVRYDRRDLGSLITDHKERRNDTAPSMSTRPRAKRGARISFADRLRSQGHEHRAAHA
jgi:excisionase family DNA binding protein